MKILLWKFVISFISELQSLHFPKRWISLFMKPCMHAHAGTHGMWQNSDTITEESKQFNVYITLYEAFNKCNDQRGQSINNTSKEVLKWWSTAVKWRSVTAVDYTELRDIFFSNFFQVNGSSDIIELSHMLTVVKWIVTFICTHAFFFARRCRLSELYRYLPTLFLRLNN